MTEYEIADLAASKVFELQGGISLVQAQIGALSDGIQQFMYALFAFLIAAYFVGASLNRRQMWVFTGLYTLWQVWMLTALIARSHLLVLIVESLREFAGSSAQPIAGIPASALSGIAVLLLTSALIASLYFMWSVRHPKTE